MFFKCQSRRCTLKKFNINSFLEKLTIWLRKLYIIQNYFLPKNYSRKMLSVLSLYSKSSVSLVWINLFTSLYSCHLTPMFSFNTAAREILLTHILNHVTLLKTLPMVLPISLGVKNKAPIMAYKDLYNLAYLSSLP